MLVILILNHLMKIYPKKNKQWMKPDGKLCKIAKLNKRTPQGDAKEAHL